MCGNQVDKDLHLPSSVPLSYFAGSVTFRIYNPPSEANSGCRALNALLKSTAGGIMQ